MKKHKQTHTRTAERAPAPRTGAPPDLIAFFALRLLFLSALPLRSVLAGSGMPAR